jgi:hypothetical protein
MDILIENTIGNVTVYNAKQIRALTKRAAQDYNRDHGFIAVEAQATPHNSHISVSFAGNVTLQVEMLRTDNRREMFSVAL